MSIIDDNHSVTNCLLIQAWNFILVGARPPFLSKGHFYKNIRMSRGTFLRGAKTKTKTRAMETMTSVEFQACYISAFSLIWFHIWSTLWMLYLNNWKLCSIWCLIPSNVLWILLNLWTYEQVMNVYGKHAKMFNVHSTIHRNARFRGCCIWRMSIVIPQKPTASTIYMHTSLWELPRASLVPNIP